MKYFLTLTLILSVFLLTAQSATTLDEYRYLSKGYAYQLEMGLDPIKNGYEIRNNYIAKNGTSIIGLYHTNAKIPQGLLLVTTDASGKSYYQALPNPASADKVLALYQQDRAQQFPMAVANKMTEAKNHYLFLIPTISQSADLARTNPAPATKYSENPTPKRPSSYEGFPEGQNDQLTAKGGMPALTPEKIAHPASPATISEGNPATNLSGTTITGKLNTELNFRTILVGPNTQNVTKAKGRVMIKFCANADGAVTYAKFTQRGSTTLNSQLKTLAIAAVRKMRLAPATNNEDCGTVGFNF